MYGIDKISNQLRNVDLAEVLKLFPNVKSEQLRRPAGEIDMQGFIPPESNRLAIYYYWKIDLDVVLEDHTPLIAEKLRS